MCALPIHPAPATPLAPSHWQAALADAITDPAELCRLLDLPAAMAIDACRAAEGFSMRVPRSFASRIRPGDPNDPLLAQVLPNAAELRRCPRFVEDPLDEAQSAKRSMVLAKYHGRSLMVTTGNCAVHCRFCFRRHFPYAKAASIAGIEEAVAHFAENPDISEALLSGGDPLTLDDDFLGRLAQRLAGIAHLSRLRVHTRLPILIPQRVGPELVAWLRGTRLTSLVVVHVNHVREIDAAVAAALGRLVDAGIPVLAQSVLLAGVNDDLETLAALYGRLAELRVMPYYLHQLDLVAGAGHFEVPVARGQQLLAQLRARLPGYAVPRYVREMPGEPSKTPL